MKKHHTLIIVTIVFALIAVFDLIGRAVEKQSVVVPQNVQPLSNKTVNQLFKESQKPTVCTDINGHIFDCKG